MTLPVRNMVICGETISEMKKLPDECVDLIFADPPYWMRVEGKLMRAEGTQFDGCDDEWDNGFETNDDYKVFTEAWLTECKRILKPNGSIWVIGGMQCIYTIGGIMQDLGFWFINDVIWHKKNPTPNFMGTRLNNSHETLIWATKSEKSKFTFNYKTAKELNLDNVSDVDFSKGARKQLGSVWRIAVCQGSERLKNDKGEKLHSTQKPEELLRRVILISSKKGDLVLDPFGGTMTTASVAKMTGRDFISFDQDPEYCRMGMKRIEQAPISIGPLELAAYDIKPKKVSISEMIEAKYLILGELFVFKDGSEGGRLTSDGKLNVHGKILDLHTGAAVIKGLKAERVNGFDYWYVERDGQLKSIAVVREEYRNSLER